MKFLIDLISEQLAGAFERAGFDAAYGKATLSNRPDLCEYQCNGALAAAEAVPQGPHPDRKRGSGRAGQK